MKKVVEEIRSKFGLLWEHEQRADLMQIGVAPDKVRSLLGWLENFTGFNSLMHLSAVDWIEDGEFQLTYMLTDWEKKVSMQVCVRIDREKAEAESVHELWPQAVTYEQEINEMFGINFPGSPRMGVDFILEGWNDIPPMRRDFDTVKYVEKHHPFRPGRHHIDPRERMRTAFGEKGYLHD